MPVVRHARSWLERLLEHVPREVAHEPALLGGREERLRPEEAARRVAPANERLGTAHDPLAEIDLRLVLHDELAALDRAPELARHREPQRRVVVEPGREHLRCAGALRRVHRDVRSAKELVSRRPVLRCDRDADAPLHLERDAGDLAGQRDRGAQPLGELERAALVDCALAQHTELVAPEAGDDLVLADDVVEPGWRRP